MSEASSPGTPSPRGDDHVTVPKPLLTIAVAFLLGGLGGTGVTLARPQPAVPAEVTVTLGEINVRLARIDSALDASVENRKKADALDADHESRIRALESRLTR